jgi:hypothetical protein
MTCGFDEDSFPLTASHSLTDLDFLCQSDPMVSTIGTHLTTAGTSTPAPRRSAPKIPPGFESPMAPLPARVVPPRFLPWVATTAAPPVITDGPPPHTWPASPVAYVRWEVGVGAARTRGAPRAALRREVGAGAQATRGIPGAVLAGRWEPELRGHVAPPELPYAGRWVLEPKRHVARPQSSPEPGGGSRSRGDMWHPHSSPEPGGGCQSRRDTWRSRSCPKPGGESQSRRDTWCP